MISVAQHLQWGAYCCLRVGKTLAWRRRGWAKSALFVVDTMHAEPALRANLAAFRCVHEARKLIETGMLAADYTYVRAAREDLLRASVMMEIDE